jgi:hypothetical protein
MGDGIEVVAMGGFTGFKTAATEELPLRPFCGLPTD